jgi:hypothetical protein
MASALSSSASSNVKIGIPGSDSPLRAYELAISSAVYRLESEFAPTVYTSKQIEAGKDKSFHMYSQPKDKLRLFYEQKMSTVSDMFRTGKMLPTIELLTVFLDFSPMILRDEVLQTLSEKIVDILSEVMKCPYPYRPVCG